MWGFSDSSLLLLLLYGILHISCFPQNRITKDMEMSQHIDARLSKLLPIRSQTIILVILHSCRHTSHMQLPTPPRVRNGAFALQPVLFSAPLCHSVRYVITILCVLSESGYIRKCTHPRDYAVSNPKNLRRSSHLVQQSGS
ncbi:uncharacterized protein EDB93DRAFT_779402 [Suillus bovinus]|uniref:uncharacterized protein n=1 Tax=Suillus bovinus TaxID=48563 RepID=UPI001B86CE83|nr:uncharacterized protein EDB93DRAFT_779402 [Suillus bovinus]KAG2136477.1 hypothetical protein EDB93DRAFT_779402 [Suillus bovinus]